MPRVNINITIEQYNTMMLEFNEMLQRWIVDDVFEFEHLGVVTYGLTPRMHVNFSEGIYNAIRNLIGVEHPRIVGNISSCVMISFESAIKALFSIREKNTFTAIDIKNYLYNHLKYLLDYDGNSLIGGYLNALE